MTENRAGGILLIMIGVIITAVWITIYGFHLYDRWYTFNVVHAKFICTYWEYFWDVGKLQMLLAGIFGSFAIVPGIYHLFKKEP